VTGSWTPVQWVVLGFAGVFLALGILFILAPRAGAGLFGLPAPEGAAHGYLPAIGLRDLAFGLYLALLAFLGSRRTLGFVFAATLVIPLGDLALVGFARGLDAPLPLALHAVSGLGMAGASLWLLSRSEPDKDDTP
jgi:hypothetical protein